MYIDAHSGPVGLYVAHTRVLYTMSSLLKHNLFLSFYPHTKTDYGKKAKNKSKLIFYK
jgi:hypothetical protein